MGKPGAMLKAARIKFIRKSHHSIIAKGSVVLNPVTHQRPKKTPARATLMRGPTIAIMNSCSGRLASEAI